MATGVLDRVISMDFIDCPRIMYKDPNFRHTLRLTYINLVNKTTGAMLL
uniref:Uncharacterized protein n=1 Tax=viral metagenome TaxID=1070528 RepID=A0A6C0M0D1_9ZZZZ